MTLGKMSEKRIFWILLLCTILVISILPLVRWTWFGGWVQGGISYHNLYGAEQLSAFDMGSANGYQLLLSFAVRASSQRFATSFLPAVLSLLSSILFYGVLKKLQLQRPQRFCAHLILLSSPGFIYVASTSSQYSLTIFLILFSVYWFLTKHGLWLSVVGFMAVSTFGIVEIVFSLTILLSLYWMFPELRKKTYVPGIVLLVLLFVNPVVMIEPVQRSLLLPELISDFGGVVGIGIFHGLLMVVGLVLSWNRKRYYLPLYILILINIISFVTLGSSLLLYLLPLLSFFGSIALVYILSIKWNDTVVRELTILILVCGLLFSSLSYYNQIARSGPTPDMIEAFEWLQKNSDPNAIVFSASSNGFWIQYWAERDVVSNDYFVQQELSHRIYASRSLNETSVLLSEESVSYLLIDENMRHKFWERPNEGLLFLLQNRETFKRQYSSKGIDIWRVVI